MLTELCRARAVLSALALTVTALSSAAGQADQTTTYTNGKWWTGDGFEAGARTICEGVFVAQTDEPPDDVIDLGGAYVIPPFGEAHNHNVDGSSGPFAIETMNQRYLRDGVFYVKNPNAYAPNAMAIRDYVRRTDTIDASFSMGGLTAKGGHPEPLYVNVLSRYSYPGKTREDFAGQAFHTIATRAQIATALDTLQDQGADFVKTYLLFSQEEGRDADFRRGDGLNPDIVRRIVRQAHDRGLKVTAHVESAQDFRAALGAGVDEINHLPGYAWRAGQTADTYRLSEHDARAAAEAGVVVVTTTVITRQFYLGRPDELNAVQALQAENLRTLAQAGVLIAIGSDDYMQTARAEIENLRAIGAFDDVTLLKLWIATPKIAIFPDRAIGCLDVGCEASFLTLADNPMIAFPDSDDIGLRVKQGHRLDLGE